MTGNKNKHDLDYLSELGYQMVKTSDADLSDLKQTARQQWAVTKQRTTPWKKYVLIAAALFMVTLGILILINKTQPITNRATKKNTSALPGPEEETTSLKEFTRSVVSENFVKPLGSKSKNNSIQNSSSNSSVDSIHVVNITTIPISLADSSYNTTQNIKFNINSPVFYLHDLKITNYYTLYFKRSKAVVLNGVPAQYINSEDPQTTATQLKQFSAIYLHEEIARAMLLFKRAKYSECKVVLKQISEYNPTDINCDFYLGMCHFYLGQYMAALPFLESCLTNSNNCFLPEAQFYRARALLETGAREEAIKNLRKIVVEEGFYASKAQDVLNSL